MNSILSTQPFYDLLCFSHLRWDFVYQRPQHLLSRAAKARRVFYIEEPVEDDGEPHLEVRRDDASGVCIVVPHLPAAFTDADREAEQRRLIAVLCREQSIEAHVQWFYTPMALPLAEGLTPRGLVYDCMDELSAFKGAPPKLLEREAELIRKASVVFTGGQALFEAKKHLHPNIHAVPSSVDKAHFAQARSPQADPADQAAIARPRLGFFGVVDERMDLELVDAVARLRPEWQFILLGPVVKVDVEELPKAANLHYLGMKSYRELPGYIAGWDVALLPFARNEATRFISPTKTPEYLAAGKPVVSTSIRDVVRPYGERGLARIADDAAAFVDACEAALGEDAAERVARADAFLSELSWDATWRRMEALLEAALGSAAPEGFQQKLTEAREAR